MPSAYPTLIQPCEINVKLRHHKSHYSALSTNMPFLSHNRIVPTSNIDKVTASKRVSTVYFDLQTAPNPGSYQFVLAQEIIVELPRTMLESDVSSKFNGMQELLIRTIDTLKLPEEVAILNKMSGENQCQQHLLDKSSNKHMLQEAAKLSAIDAYEQSTRYKAAQVSNLETCFSSARLHLVDDEGLDELALRATVHVAIIVPIEKLKQYITSVFEQEILSINPSRKGKIALYELLKEKVDCYIPERITRLIQKQSRDSAQSQSALKQLEALLDLKNTLISLSQGRERPTFKLEDQLRAAGYLAKSRQDTYSPPHSEKDLINKRLLVKNNEEKLLSVCGILDGGTMQVDMSWRVVQLLLSPVAYNTICERKLVIGDVLDIAENIMDRLCNNFFDISFHPERLNHEAILQAFQLEKNDSYCKNVAFKLSLLCMQDHDKSQDVKAALDSINSAIVQESKDKLSEKHKMQVREFKPVPKQVIRTEESLGIWADMFKDKEESSSKKIVSESIDSVEYVASKSEQHEQTSPDDIISMGEFLDKNMSASAGKKVASSKLNGKASVFIPGNFNNKNFNTQGKPAGTNLTNYNRRKVSR